MQQVRDLIDDVKSQAIEVDSCIRRLGSDIVVPVARYKEEKHKLIDRLQRLEAFHNRFASEAAYR